MRKYFGTDGVRGRANQHPMTAEVALRIGMAAGRYFRRGAHQHRVVIGKDTRISCYMIENALIAGLAATGMDVYKLGPVPTPAVGMLTRSLRADVGIMISASHNSFEDNGIKLFGPDGFKLSDEVETQIEAYMDDPAHDALAESRGLGRVYQLDDGRARYVEFAKATFPRSRRLDGMKIVVDCANGAAYRTAPAVLWELGAEVISIGTEPDGCNINLDCGSTAPARCQRMVVENGADLGIALDGDADRVHIIDEKGRIVDGDQLMGMIALSWARQGRLRGGGLVATVMSNLGLERRLQAEGLMLERTAVGDRYVVERMRLKGYNVGGEQSGHIVLTDFVTTGDGTIAALQVVAALMEEDRPLSEAAQVFAPVPQLLKNVRFQRGQKPLSDPMVQKAIAEGEARLQGQGRLLIRASGTEPVIRVMGEGDDALQVSAIVDMICTEVTAAAARLAG